MLEGDALKDIRDILTSVGSRLEILVNLFPFDDHDVIRFLFEQQRNGIARQAVGFIFQAVDPNAALDNGRMRLPQ